MLVPVLLEYTIGVSRPGVAALAFGPHFHRSIMG
jgi:hypothetical protein